MLYAAAIALLSLIASLCLTLAGWGSAIAVAHLAFAVGIVPLIFAAISHFVPVLTRSGDPGRLIACLPFVAQLAGLLAVAALGAWLPRSFLHAAAAVDLVLAIILLRWIVTRARTCLGSPHPGWRWYALATACLILALLAVPVMTALPVFYVPLRAWHLHLNTLGLVGFAAFGTLPVLLPTALGRADPAAANYLRRYGLPMLGGVLLVAIGSAVAWPLAVVGGALLLFIVLGLLRHWLQFFGAATVFRDGAAASLFSAALGFVLVLFAGFLHALGLVAGYQTIPVWAAAFLLPLVTGALSQLLPVWRWPGPSLPGRAVMRQKLVATGVWRGGLCFIGGIALTAGFLPFGAAAVALALLLFVIALIQALRVARSTA